MINSGTEVNQAATILGDAEVQGAFGGIDAANARIAANQDSFNEALDGLDSSITTTPLASSYVGVPIPLGLDGKPISGYQPQGTGSGTAPFDPTQGAFDSDNPIVQALRPVGDAATALANLNDRFSGLADAIVIAGQAVVGGGGVGQVVIRLGKAVGGQTLDYISDQAHDFVVNKLDTYLGLNTDLNPLTRGLISQAGGFGVDAVFGTALGVSSKQVIGDAGEVRQLNTISKNAADGRARERYVQRKLEGHFPNASVQREQYLRNSDGTIAQDAFGKARRIDHAVVEDGKVRYLVETTSKTAEKSAQTAKEVSIRSNGSVFIRDRDTGQLIDVSEVQTRTSRRK